jgi:transcriptional regulator with XRE-family HTH domain
MFYEKLGSNISVKRDERGYNQAQFARALGIPQSTLAGYESGKRKISVKTLKQTADLLGVKVDFLLDIL